MQAYATCPRAEWVREWPAMVVLAVSQIYWSRQCEAAISAGDIQGYLAQVGAPC
jgi:dynein heavy chain